MFMQISIKPALVFSLVIIAAMAVILFWMGREPICKCGEIKLWHGVVISSENSLHFSDWYTPSHILHGLAFYALGWMFLRRFSIGFRLILATLLEVAWEIVENTDAIINHYREATISLDYYGDSVINSVADCAAMLAGFFLARILPVWASIALFIVAEAVTARIAPTKAAAGTESTGPHPMSRPNPSASTAPNPAPAETPRK